MTHPPMVGRDDRGRALYDLSRDRELAAAGDEQAEARESTRRYLTLRALLRQSTGQE